MGISCERATVAHLEALIALMEPFYREEGLVFEADFARQALAGLLSNPAYGAAWQICSGPETVGYIVLTFGYSLEFGGRDTFIDEFFILPAWRGQGIGSQVLAFVADFCRSEGIGAIHLEVQSGNRAIRLYDRAGFEEHDAALMTCWMIPPRPRLPRH